MNLNELFTKGVHLSKANIRTIVCRAIKKFLKIGVTEFCENVPSNLSLIPIFKHCCEPRAYFETTFPCLCYAEGRVISKDDYLKTDQP